MKKCCLLLFSLLVTSVVSAATLTFAWTVGDNPSAAYPPWVTVVSYGVQPGVYTNSVTVPYTQTTVTISNLVAGVRYYAAAQHSDGTDSSIYSNEVNVKIKPNPPKNLAGSAP